jgi:hypothetical protein
MRLLDTTTLEFREFPDLPDEPYAILSHRWGSEEVTFKEYRKSRATIQHRAGYKKIVEFCHIAKQRGFSYGWIDTCCIDKRSSAELSEAINSMYRWYGKSTECYVFLEDYVPADPASLRSCEWFRRGWTLQELIAPRYCVFFTSTWAVVGHKHHFRATRCQCKRVEVALQATHSAWGPDLLEDLASTTKIDNQILSGSRGINGESIAQRMSWASGRATTRLEDRAYSLFGIFGVNMPLLYGEGPGAFRRLQEEIIRTTHDTSIFCFRKAKSQDLVNNMSYPGTYSRYALPLAENPDEFSASGSIGKGEIQSEEPYSITHRGLRMVTPAYVCKSDGWERIQPIYAIPLGCIAEPFETMYLIVQPAPSKGHDGCSVIRRDAQTGEDHPPHFKGMHTIPSTWESIQSRLFFVCSLP